LGVVVQAERKEFRLFALPVFKAKYQLAGNKQQRLQRSAKRKTAVLFSCEAE
jgi:hypothetical protein